MEFVVALWLILWIAFWILYFYLIFFKKPKVSKSYDKEVREECKKYKKTIREFINENSSNKS